MKKVLIVEDEDCYIDRYTDALTGKVVLLFADNVANAIRMFDENTDVAVVVMDACLSSGSMPNSMPVVKHIREAGYTGDIIANSSSFNRTLKAVGCNLECWDGSKSLIPKQLIELLGLQ